MEDVMARRSVMVHAFSQVPQAHIERSSFDRSFGVKTTFNESDLVPIFIDEALPGDTFNVSLATFGRLATPIFPFMDNLYLDFFFFFVPNRLVWTHFVNFFGEQDNPTDTTSFIVPTITIPVGSNIGSTIQQLADYFGIPVNAAQMHTSFTVNSLPFRAYNLIWNQWFRDENLQNSVVVQKDDGPDVAANYVVLKRGKRKDYFTGCLPFPQKGPAVNLPLGTSAPVKTSATLQFVGPGVPVMQWANAAGGFPPAASSIGIAGTTGNVNFGAATFAGATGGVIPVNLMTDLSAATAATINQLRQAFQIQKIYERDARGGTRYTELIKAHFGVTSPDARLQRAEYLGGGSAPINVNPIAQTSATGLTGSTSPQGNLAAMGTVHSNGIGFTKSFTEHGYIIGLVNARADLTYQDGIEKLWLRSTRFDFYWPALAHIGEQSVLNAEIYATGDPVDSQTFGYQERYGEYRYKISRVMGLFRSTSAAPLDAWHLSQHFSALPVLNAAFIVDQPPISRVVAVPTQPRFLLDVHFSMRCARPMPVFGVPGLIDHF
ncbi:major capsid protein [Blackfly microvirus SF02]|uniref:Major capsid protein n=1 Tax=Blackfly microvirus SF02 TaxID=2576452 RepID=A0A4P8PJI3_9VIRU|nr:major capsid protein [Blackfly microvirus SF02]